MRMRGLSWVLSIALAAAVQSAVAASGSAPAVKHSHTNAAHKTAASQGAALHALGVLLSQQLTTFQLSESEFRSVASGFADGYHHPGAVKQAQTLVPQLQALAQSRAELIAQREERAGRAYLDKVAALPGAKKTATGLVYVAIKQGAGPSPKVGDQVKVQYTGKLTDGSVFDSSEKRGPATFTLGRVIPCWNEGLQLMKVGGKARIVCPSTLAYGDRGVEGVIKPGATLNFEVELLDVHHAAAPGNAVPFAPGAPAAHP